MKAFLINPFAQTLTEVDYASEDFHAIYPLLSRPESPVKTFATVGVYRNYYPAGHDADTVFVDDEGLLNWGAKQQQFFAIESESGEWRPLAGMGLWTGTDLEGETIAPSFTLAQAQAAVRFLSHTEVMQWQD